MFDVHCFIHIFYAYHSSRVKNSHKLAIYHQNTKIFQPYQQPPEGFLQSRCK